MAVHVLYSVLPDKTLLAFKVVKSKAMRNCEIYAILSYAEFRNSGIPDDGNLTEIYWTSVNPELCVNLMEILMELRNFLY